MTAFPWRPLICGLSTGLGGLIVVFSRRRLPGFCPLPWRFSAGIMGDGLPGLDLLTKLLCRLCGELRVGERGGVMLLTSL